MRAIEQANFMWPGPSYPQGSTSCDPWATIGIVVNRYLTSELGTALRRHRDRAQWTQRQLADAAGVSPTTIAHLERGSRAPSLPMLTRLFATLGSQLRFEVEPLDAHVDAEMDRLAEIPLDGRVRQSGVDLAVADLNALRIPHVVEGAAAALLHGVPIPVAAVDLDLRWADADELTTWLDRRWARRWDERWQDFGFQAPDPRLVGAHDWWLIFDGAEDLRLRAEMCDELPDAIEIHHRGTSYRIRPLHEIEIADPRTADLLRRYRSRSAQLSL